MNLNLVQICGRLSKKPELRALPSGSAITTFSVATNRTWKDKSGQKQEETEWHNVTAFGRTAEVIAQYFDRGDEIYIQGRLKTSSWEGKDGIKKYRTDIIADRMDFGQKARGNQQRSASAPEEAPAEVDDGEINPEDIPF